MVFATAWLLGDGARNRRDRARALEARAEQLELTRAAEAEAAVVAERNRIARELHDVVAHHVSMIVVQAEAGPVAMERDPAAAAAAFDTISAVGKQALAEASNRRVASRPETPRDVRCRTATTYAVTPTDQMSQARREDVIVPMVPDARHRWVVRGIT